MAHLRAIRCGFRRFSASPTASARSQGRAMAVASVLGSLALGWSLGERAGRRESAEQEGNWRRWSEYQICQGSGLMTPRQAQKSPVLRLEQVLSDTEIVELRAFATGMWRQQLPGHTSRDEQAQVQEKGSRWHTAFLHTGGLFEQRFPILHERLKAAICEADAKQWRVLQGRDPMRLNFRTIECHEYGPTGHLTEEGHYDAGSLLTLDVMLSVPGSDFKGGAFATPEQDGSMKVSEFGKGDALLFLSHKYHNVMPVTEGERSVLVLELWDGPSRTCPHRCLTVGPCERSVTLRRKGS